MNDLEAKLAEARERHTIRKKRGVRGYACSCGVQTFSIEYVPDEQLRSLIESHVKAAQPQMKAANEGGYCQFCRKPFKVTDAQRKRLLVLLWGSDASVQAVCDIIESTNESAYTAEFNVYREQLVQMTKELAEKDAEIARLEARVFQLETAIAKETHETLKQWRGKKSK
jgi:hypothetical protein